MLMIANLIVVKSKVHDLVQLLITSWNYFQFLIVYNLSETGKYVHSENAAIVFRIVNPLCSFFSPSQNWTGHSRSATFYRKFKPGEAS